MTIPINDKELLPFYQKLNNAGKDGSDWREASLEIMNEFMRYPYGVEFLAPNGFYIRKIAILCDRIAQAERMDQNL